MMGKVAILFASFDSLMELPESTRMPRYHFPALSVFGSLKVPETTEVAPGFVEVIGLVTQS